MMRRSGFTLMVFVLSVIGVLYVWMRMDLSRVGYEIEALKQQKSRLERQQESLQLQLSQLTAPQKIAQAAMRDLELDTPKPGQIVLVTPEMATPIAHGEGHRSTRGVRLAQHQTFNPGEL